MGHRSRIVLGLNSGTSADGVDVAACEISGRGERMHVRLIGHLHRAYSPELRERLLAIMAPAQTTTEELCRLNTAVGRAFAEAALAMVQRLKLKRVDLVGSHGQTVCHLPPRVPLLSSSGKWNKARRVPLLSSSGSGRKTTDSRANRRHKTLVENNDTIGLETGTFQIGDAAIIAARLGVPVVSNFRQGDMAVGGQGAPLVPWTDWVLFRDAGVQGRTRVVQNIGGIANLTWLPCGTGLQPVSCGTGYQPVRGIRSNPRPCTADDVIAFDTGPGNMLIDALVSHFSNGRQAYDRGGAMARRGRVMDDVLSHVLAHPYFRRPAPKSCGREEFGAGYAADLLRRFGRRGRSDEDWIATATCITAESIASAYGELWHRRSAGESKNARRLAGINRVRSATTTGGTPVPQEQRRGTGGSLEIILCGGGAKNRTLRDMMTAAVSGRLGFSPESATTDNYGIPTQAKECVSFAMLAVARMDRVPANLVQVTGAKSRAVLGCVTEP